MLLIEREIDIPQFKKDRCLLTYFEQSVRDHLNDDEIPVRFVITESDDNKYHCELGVLKGGRGIYDGNSHSIFSFMPREYENPDKFNAVLLVPTGIGAEIGGHSGDAGPVARLIASVCDNLITHPNVVNASDINELPDNGLYVEGSVITRLLMGAIGLQKVRSNRVMLIIDKHEDKLFYESAINAVSAARSALGLDCPVVVTMEDKLLMRSLYSSSGRAVGRIDYFERVCEILRAYRDKYDAVALSSVIKVPVNFHRDYYLEDMVNPWGGVEAMLTHAISLFFNIPSAHSPMLESREILDLDLGVIDPRKAAEIVSVTFLHSILKGLHRSPRIVLDPSAGVQPGVLTAADIDCLIIPDHCVGIPTLAAIEQEIPVIAVKENKNKMKNDLSSYPFKPGKLIYVENYLEAVGIMAAMKAGVAPETVRRPLRFTNVEQKTRFRELKHEYQDKKITELSMVKDKKASKSI
jgi:hypothetical protein